MNNDRHVRTDADHAYEAHCLGHCRPDCGPCRQGRASEACAGAMAQIEAAIRVRGLASRAAAAAGDRWVDHQPIGSTFSWERAGRAAEKAAVIAAAYDAAVARGAVTREEHATAIEAADEAARAAAARPRAASDRLTPAWQR